LKISSTVRGFEDDISLFMKKILQFVIAFVVVLLYFTSKLQRLKVTQIQQKEKKSKEEKDE